jgi:hypothetical protein
MSINVKKGLFIVPYYGTNDTLEKYQGQIEELKRHVEELKNTRACKNHPNIISDLNRKIYQIEEKILRQCPACYKMMPFRDFGSDNNIRCVSCINCHYYGNIAN